MVLTIYVREVFIVSIMTENLKTLRTTAGYSQKELAEMAGTYQGSIAKIELANPIQHSNRVCLFWVVCYR